MPPFSHTIITSLLESASAHEIIRLTWPSLDFSTLFVSKQGLRQWSSADQTSRGKALRFQQGKPRPIYSSVATSSP